MDQNGRAVQQAGGEIDTSVPHSARIWNYWLGGKDNYAADREAGEQYRQAFPGIDELARASRYFLVRTIRFLAAEAGVRQFLDVGTGLPTVDNTHEVAQREAPEARVVYVDNDPLVLVHANALLTSSPEGRTSYIEADLRDPATVIAGARETLDLSRPVALILSGVLGHIGNHAEACAIVRGLMSELPSGSYLSHNDGIDENPDTNAAQDDYNDSGAVPYVLRSPEQIRAYYDGLELVPPGVVRINRWRPDVGEAEAPEAAAYGGVGRKP
ncbi:S-adenosyl methyltransferase [Streptomyces abyssalis]|uniref:S-adenosyl methyltransferase n=1 Tax=Streptomyces abyssalis TaxID=933944 RepID=A0A1E7JKE8_9ACTN|nr:SAM-dependent methyltransferase [Streptomyces abyssalis]OEU88113.1 S-adenosyl methyltransferase [Streptomyces abyssalis]OEU90984.1 S-adenosyl methyltransferase [Streptomyces abyssalis]